MVNNTNQFMKSSILEIQLRRNKHLIFSEIFIILVLQKKIKNILGRMVFPESYAQHLICCTTLTEKSSGIKTDYKLSNCDQRKYIIKTHTNYPLFFFFKLDTSLWEAPPTNPPQQKPENRNVVKAEMYTYHHELASTTTCMRSVRSVSAKTQCLESSKLPKGQQAGRQTQSSLMFRLPEI